jgi:transcriptional regulator with XRE-family HTH domain
VARVSNGKSARRHLRSARPSTVGRLLKQWRERRRMSQLGLALEAEISTRHLSFLETGRTQPSREMVLLLSRVLEVPLRGRNELLTAAGYAPVYRETGLDAPEMAQVKQALGFMLRQQEPFPAMVLDRHWNILVTNDAMGKVMGLFLDPAATAALGPANAMRLSYPDVPTQWQLLDLDASTAPFLAIELAKGDVRFSFFTLLASLGTPYDITLHELRIECFFAADAATDEALRRL